MKAVGARARLACRSVVLGVLVSAAAFVEVAARDSEVEPVGVWNCLMYGPSGDQRFYLRQLEDGRVGMARIAEAADGVWRPLAEWRRSRDRLEFDDRANARLFVAGLRGEELGGTWRGLRDRGGWWCARTVHAVEEDEPPPVGGLMAVLVPAIMASPSYPLTAIHEAKEGRTVSCFIVTGTGEILRPEVVESTDEIFREPTLEAVENSRFASWGDDDAVLPACRSFTFELRPDG